jgi:hypothetical protein
LSLKLVQVLWRNQDDEMRDFRNAIWMIRALGGDLEEISVRPTSRAMIVTTALTLHSLGVMSPQKKGKDPFFAAPSTADVGSGPVINHLRTLPVVVSLPPGTSARYLTPLPSSSARELIILETVGDVPRKA